MKLIVSFLFSLMIVATFGATISPIVTEVENELTTILDIENELKDILEDVESNEYKSENIIDKIKAFTEKVIEKIKKFRIPDEVAIEKIKATIKNLREINDEMTLKSKQLITEWTKTVKNEFTELFEDVLNIFKRN